MERQHGTRRIVLSAAVVRLAILTALGGGDGSTPKDEGSAESRLQSAVPETVREQRGRWLMAPSSITQRQSDGLLLRRRLQNGLRPQGNNCYRLSSAESRRSPAAVVPSRLEWRDHHRDSPAGGRADRGGDADRRRAGLGGHSRLGAEPRRAPGEAPMQTIARRRWWRPPSRRLPRRSTARLPRRRVRRVGAPVEAPVILTEEPRAAEAHDRGGADGRRGERRAAIRPEPEWLRHDTPSAPGWKRCPRCAHAVGCAPPPLGSLAAVAVVEEVQRSRPCGSLAGSARTMPEIPCAEKSRGRDAHLRLPLQVRVLPLPPRRARVRGTRFKSRYGERLARARAGSMSRPSRLSAVSPARVSPRRSDPLPGTGF